MKLVVLQDSISRRQVLLVCGAGATAACSASAPDAVFNPVTDWVDAGPTHPTGHDAGRDTGHVVGHDAGRLDAGHAMDTGAQMSDTGVTEVDAGMTTDLGNPVVDTGVDVGPACSPGPTLLGPVSNYPLDQWVMDSGDQLIVGHDSGGLFAYSNVCPHAGCPVTLSSPSTGASVCYCHGSQFDGNGAVTRGPARSPMDHYPVTLCGGMVYVDTSTTVPASTRTPV